MIAAVQERLETTEAFFASECETEQRSLEDAERLMRSVGGLAVKEAVKNPQSRETLMEAIHEAAAGSEEARQLVEANVAKDVIERTIKSGHITSAEVDVDSEGRLVQHGQYIDDVQKNSLAYASDHAVIKRRTNAEIRNSKRIENLNREGHLEDHYMLVLSRCEDDMSDEELGKLGFFNKTKSTSIQISSAENGNIKTESAFVAGVKEWGGERHDRQTVENLLEKLGLEFEGKTAAQLLDSPIIIQKEMLPGGVIDVVKMYDDAAGGTFFGEAKPQQDYNEYLKYCQKREKEFKPLVQEIVDRLISEAATINSPIAATKRLHKLSQEVMLNRAIEDKTINPLVFGEKSAVHITEAQAHITAGRLEAAMRSINSAQKDAVSGSCPSALKQEEDLDSTLSNDAERSRQSWHGGKIKKGTCVSCHQGPKDVGVKGWCKSCIKC